MCVCVCVCVCLAHLLTAQKLWSRNDHKTEVRDIDNSNIICHGICVRKLIYGLWRFYLTSPRVFRAKEK